LLAPVRGRIAFELTQRRRERQLGGQTAHPQGDRAGGTQVEERRNAERRRLGAPPSSSQTIAPVTSASHAVAASTATISPPEQPGERDCGTPGIEHGQRA
jgi:hypothetical protein